MDSVKKYFENLFGKVISTDDPDFKRKRLLVITVTIIIVIILFIPLVFFAISALGLKESIKDLEKTKGQKTFSLTAPYVPDELIVKLKASYTEEELARIEKKFKELGVVSQKKAFESEDPLLRNYYLLTFKKGTDIKKAGQELTDLRELVGVEPNYLVEVQASPNDPFLGQLWGLEKIQMQKAWDISQGSNSVIVAVVDTGIDYNHQDFVGRNIIKGKDFSTCDLYSSNDSCSSPKERDSDPMDDHGHGTHVAGTIGAATDNNIGIAGVNWNITLMAVKTIGKDGRGTTQDIVDGVVYASDNRANIINLSFGQSSSCSGSYQNVINYAMSRGSIIVVAAGNNNVNAQNYSPASCSGVIAVGATTSSDGRASFSNWGIYSLSPGNSYKSRNGTSMAAPHVAGVAALLLAANSSLSSAQVESCLVRGADPINTDKPIGPRLNAYKALTTCLNISPVPTGASPTGMPTITLSPTPSQVVHEIYGGVFIDANGNKAWDAGESGYSGAQITTSGMQALSTLTDTSGIFSFPNVAVGSYSVNLIIGGQIRATAGAFTITNNTRQIRVFFFLPPSILTPTTIGEQAPSPTPIQITPTVIQTTPTLSITRQTSPSPTPIQTYTCRESTPAKKPLPGSIKIGSLVCEPN